MNLETISEMVSALPGVVEVQPFGPTVDVFKVGGKMFALLAPESSPEEVSLKCEPEWAIDLREKYGAITPGYHLSKRHWNTVALDGTVDDELVSEMVMHSYELVVAGLTKAAQARLDPELYS
ncbi:MAG: MmcQ/YjbR family DNA-binding protein [Acidimicrobiales bacterium]